MAMKVGIYGFMYTSVLVRQLEFVSLRPSLMRLHSLTCDVGNESTKVKNLPEARL